MTLKEEQLFLESLNTQFNQVSNKDNLSRIRKKAWDRFIRLGLPSKKDPIYRPLRLNALYTRALHSAEEKKLAQKDVAPHQIKNASASIVFINGKFSKEHSQLENLPDSIVLHTLPEAMQTYSSLLNTKLGKSIGEEEHPFALMNYACQTSGVFLYIPPQIYLEKPIEILHIVDTEDQPTTLFPNINVFVGKLSEVKFEVHTKYLSEDRSLFSGMFEAVLEEGAKVHTTVALANPPKDALHFYNVRAQVKRNSSFKGIHITNGGKRVHTDWRVSLAGENSEVDLSGLYILRGNSEAHTHIIIDHQAPNCRSMQLFKGVLHDRARSSFDGKIVVQQAAQKTEAYQLNNNLVLSPDARADTKPNLKIFADDVVASHGATVGQLDEEQMLYLMTRGISKEMAQDLLVKGFCQQVIQLIPDHFFQELATSWE